MFVSSYGTWLNVTKMLSLKGISRPNLSFIKKGKFFSTKWYKIKKISFEIRKCLKCPIFFIILRRFDVHVYKAA